MTVSVIIRTYNRPAFLRRALADIAAQTRLPDEVIIVNDGGARADVDAAAATVTLPVTIVDAGQQLGRAEAANAGITAAQSDLVTLHDDDDTWDPGFLEQTADWLEQHPDADALVTKIDIIRERVLGDGAVEVLEQFPFEGHLREVTLLDLLRVNRFTPIGFVYRRALHEQLGVFDSHLPVVEDWDWHMRVAARGSIPVLQTDHALAFWRQRPDATGSDSNSTIAEQDQHRRFDALKRDELLRSDPSGLGGLVYLTRFIDERAHDLHMRFDEQHAQVDRLQEDLRETTEQIARLEQTISDASLVAWARRRWRRFRGR
nr:glycosyltransferase family 2 protein [Pseudoclavibacter sp. 13-3]